MKDALHKLVKIIASEPDPHLLIIDVAADREIIRAVQQLYRQESEGPDAGHEVVRQLCLAHGVPVDLFYERFYLIVRILNLSDHNEDYYEILQVSPTATQEEIKQAFRRQSLASHPDTNPDDPLTAESFRGILRAYEILGNEKLRAQYDRCRSHHNWEEQAALSSEPEQEERDDDHHFGQTMTIRVEVSKDEESGWPFRSLKANGTLGAHGRNDDLSSKRKRKKLYAWMIGAAVAGLLIFAFWVHYQSLMPEKYDHNGNRKETSLKPGLATERKTGADSVNQPMPDVFKRNPNEGFFALLPGGGSRDGGLLPAGKDKIDFAGQRYAQLAPVPAEAVPSDRPASFSPREKLQMPPKSAADQATAESDAAQRPSKPAGQMEAPAVGAKPVVSKPKQGGGQRISGLAPTGSKREASSKAKGERSKSSARAVTLPRPGKSAASAPQARSSEPRKKVAARTESKAQAKTDQSKRDTVAKSARGKIAQRVRTDAAEQVKSTDRSYKSPARKPDIQFLEESRKQWKAQCFSAKHQIRLLNNKIRYLEKHKAKLSDKVKELEKQLDQVQKKKPGKVHSKVKKRQ